MSPIVTFPTAEEQDQQNRFSVYCNYINSISNHLTVEGIFSPQKFEAVVGSRSFQSINGRKDVDLVKIGKLLRNAWFTEVQIWMSGMNPNFSAYSNHWLGVQSYYSVYLALRALFLGMKNDVGREHTKNLREVSRIIGDRPTLFPDPWRITCGGNPEGHVAYANMPNGVSIASVSALTSASKISFYDSYAMFLKTTRRRLIEQKCELWKEQSKKKRISSKQKTIYIENQHPTTLFDCLFRLRVRSNYEDADTFLLTDDNSLDAKLFNRSFRLTVWHTLFLIELLLARHISKHEYEQILNSFSIRGMEKLTKSLVKKRWELMSRLW